MIDSTIDYEGGINMDKMTITLTQEEMYALKYTLEDIMDVYEEADNEHEQEVAEILRNIYAKLNKEV